MSIAAGDAMPDAAVSGLGRKHYREDIMSKLVIWSIACAVCGLATPVFAASPDGAAASGAHGAAQAKPKAETHYCVGVTGAQARRKECKIRKEWLVEGVDALIR